MQTSLRHQTGLESASQPFMKIQEVFVFPALFVHPLPPSMGVEDAVRICAGVKKYVVFVSFLEAEELLMTLKG